MKKVLIVGATGFLGPALVEEFSLAGFEVICGVRNLEKAANELKFSGVRFAKINLNEDISPDIWLERLKEYQVDGVVNNVGIANTFGNQSLENVNLHAPVALFKAIRQMNNEQNGEKSRIRVVQISTTGVNWPDCEEYGYPRTKKKTDEALTAMNDLDYTIVRPNVVYEPERGHLLLAQIARIPIIFYIGKADIQPVYCRELAVGIVRLILDSGHANHKVLQACGPVPMTWKEIFFESRRALGKGRAIYFPIPLKPAQLFTWFIQFLPKIILKRFGLLSRIDPETIMMMTRGSIGCHREWSFYTGIRSIYLYDVYKTYEDGTESYQQFLKKIRNEVVQFQDMKE